MIKFSVGIIPRGKGRPRATVRGGFASVYTDDKTRKYEAAISRVAMVAMRGQKPLQGPLLVVLQFRLPVPVSYSKRRRAAILAGEEAFYGAFDADNLGKAVLDALNSVCFTDDKQITRLTMVKVPAENPGVDIHIEQIGLVARIKSFVRELTA